MIHGKEIITLKEDKDYLNWLIELKQRFLSQRLKASSAVNANLLEFYLSVGKDIEVRQYANTYGSGFFDNLSKDMKRILPGVQGLSPINLRYMNRFYRLYSLVIGNLPQPAEDFNPTPKANVPQPAEDLALREIMSIPWDHHRRIIDKCGNDVQKALFFVKKTHENNWSRNVLVNWLSTDLYEREGKAITNFSSTLPEIQGDLAQQIKQAPAFARVLTQDGKIVPLSAAECDWLVRLTGPTHVVEPSIGVIEGDRVTITDGPLVGMESQIKKIDRHKRLAYLDVHLLGRTKTVKVGVEIVRKTGEGSNIGAGAERVGSTTG